MINNKVKALRHGLIILYSKDNILWVKNMVRVNFNGKMDQNILVILIIILYKDMENIHGMMVENILVHGKIIKWMVRV